MSRYQLLLPKMGESVAEATVINWLKKPGDQIEADDAVVEIATDKVDSEVPSPVSGRLVEQLFQKDDVVQVGSVIAVIEVEDAIGDDPAQAPIEELPLTTIPERKADEVEAEIPGISELSQRSNSADKTVGAASGARFYSPLVRNIAVQEGLTSAELDAIPGSGAGGRLTKDDLINYIKNRGGQQVNHSAQPHATQGLAATATADQSQNPNGLVDTAPTLAEKLEEAETKIEHPQTATNTEQETPQIPAAPESNPVTQPGSPQKATSLAGETEILEMDRMRRLISEHMVRSRDTAVHVSSFVEADVTNLVYWREKHKKGFESRENEKLTFTPLFIEAVVKAIQDFPMINVSIEGNNIIRKHNINIGLATALPNGNLIVPVIHDAARMNISGLARSVNDLANRARINKLKPDEIRYGTFTITNIGGFGNVMGTPIINQPQVAILAIGTIKKKPAVLETPTGDVIAIRHMMFLSLSYDHRFVDGALGGMFLKRVADYLENWDMNREV